MTPSQEAREYPPLPEADAWPLGPAVPFFGPEKMRSYVDADRKTRQQAALDARRYRWLIEHKPVSLLKMCPSPHEWHYAIHDVVDAAIDAAIAKGEQS